MPAINSRLFRFNYNDIAPALAALGCIFRVNGVSGRGISDKTVASREIPGSDGALFLSKSIPPRTIAVEYSLITEDITTLRAAERELNRLLTTDEPKRLEFEDQEGYYNAVHESVDVSTERRGIQDGTITFYCADPFLYGSFGAESGAISTTPITVPVETNYTVLPIYYIRLTSPQKKIIVTTNGRAITYEQPVDLPTNTTIMINGRTKEVRINETDLKVLQIDGWFPYFKNGDNTITTSVPAYIDVEYQERFL